MDKITLTERINKKITDIAKANKSLAKYLAECTKEEATLINDYLLTGDKNPYRQWLKNNNRYYGGDAWSKAIDLYDAQNTLAKYQNMLKAIEERESTAKINTIWEFLLSYKELVIEWLKNNAINKDLYFKEESKYCDMANSRKYTKEELLKQENIYRKYKNQIHPLTNKYYSPRRGWDMAGLNKYLDKDIEDKYFQLIDQVTKITGEILSAEGLKIKAGELNGVIKGTKGIAKIHTISAGGYNIQCFHYRTLVKEVK